LTNISPKQNVAIIQKLKCEKMLQFYVNNSVRKTVNLSHFSSAILHIAKITFNL